MKALQPAAATLEAAQRMDANYRLQRHVYDFTRRWFLLGRTRLLDRLALAPGQSVLEVGCGTAWNLARLARRHPEARLTGIDASSAMLATARRKLAAAGLLERIELRQGLAQDLAATAGAVPSDVVLLSYVLSMIPDWRTALQAAESRVRPGGLLAVVDFGDMRRLPRFARRGLKAWLGRFHTQPRESLPTTLRELADRRGTASQIEFLPGRYAFLGLIRL